MYVVGELYYGVRYYTWDDKWMLRSKENKHVGYPVTVRIQLDGYPVSKFPTLSTSKKVSA